MAIDIVRSEEQVAIEIGLPAYMFALLFDSLRQKAGLVVRADLEELANKASAIPFAKLDMFRTRRFAKIMEDHGYKILKAANEDDLRPVVGALARLLCKIAAQDIPVEENAVMIALAISDEIDNGEESWGNPKYMNALMARMDNEVRRLGYFPAPLLEEA